MSTINFTTDQWTNISWRKFWIKKYYWKKPKDPFFRCLNSFWTFYIFLKMIRATKYEQNFSSKTAQIYAETYFYFIRRTWPKIGKNFGPGSYSKFWIVKFHLRFVSTPSLCHFSCLFNVKKGEAFVKPFCQNNRWYFFSKKKLVYK